MLSKTINRSADPVAPDGIRVSQHVEMVIRCSTYLSDTDSEKLATALSLLRNDDAKNYEQAEDFLEHISVAEEVQATATLLKLLRKNMSRDTSKADIDTIKAIQSINTSLNTMNKMLPQLNSASRIIRLQNALITFGKSLPADQRKPYMAAMRSALIDEIED